MLGGDSKARFIRDNTKLMPVPHAPEISLHLAHEAFDLWHKTEDELEQLGLPAPYWAFAWAGGQALARYILDHPGLCANKQVIDLGAGSGLAGIAAAITGASHVFAADPDPFTPAAIALNAQVNNCAIEATTEDLLSGDCPPCDVLLIGDLFFDREIAPRVDRFARGAMAAGAKVLIGDPGRAYLPADQLEMVAEYMVPVMRALEDSETKRTRVWTYKD